MSRRLSTTDLVLRLLAVAGLLYSGYVHWHLHGTYAGGSGLTQSDIFVAQAIACVLVSVVLLAYGLLGRDRGALGSGAWLLAFLVAAGSLTAVLLYRYVNVGKLGPLPNMYEPIWYPLKTRSAYAEGLATVASAIGLVRALVLTRSATRGAAAETAREPAHQI